MVFSPEFLAVVGGLFAGAIGGFIYSLVGWFKGDEAFSTKKNLSAIFLGVIGGITLALGEASLFAKATTDYELLILYVTIALSGSGVAALVPRAIKSTSKPSE